MRFAFFILVPSLILISASLASAQLNDTAALVAANVSDSNSSAPAAIPLNITVSLNKDKFYPGEKMKIRGEVMRGNESDIDGEAWIMLEHGYNIKFTNGKFGIDLQLDNATKSGKREMDIEVTDSENNKGAVKKEFYVIAVPARIDIYLNNNSFSPGGMINASAVLLDQVGDPISGEEMVMTLYDARGGAVIDRRPASNLVYGLPRGAMPGEWWVYAYSNDIKERRFFKVEEYPKVEYSLKSGKLIIKNVGNVPYNKPVSITFSGSGLAVTEIKDVDIGVGKGESFNLAAPDGNYRVYVTTNGYEEKFEGITLTGGAVGAKQILPNNGAFIFTCIAAAIALLAVLMRFYGKGKKKNSKQAMTALPVMKK